MKKTKIRMKHTFSSLIILLIFISCNLNEQNEIRNVSNNFIQGKIDMLAKSKFELIDKYSTKEFSELYKLFNIEIDLVNYKRIRGIKILEQTKIDAIEIINKDTAVCKLKSQNIKELNLIKVNTKWLIAGTNGTYVSTKLIEEKKQRIIKLKKENKDILMQKPVLNSMMFFNGNLVRMFRNNDFSTFNSYCSKSTVSFLKIFRKEVLKKEKMISIIEKLKVTKFNPAIITFSNDSTAVCNFKTKKFNRIYNLKKLNNKWQIVGFNNHINHELNSTILKKDFISFIQTFGIYRKTSDFE